MFVALPLCADEPVDFFEKKIRPVLAERCYKCHSASSEKLKGGLLLDTREGALKGGESGRPSVVPGDAEASLLIEAIRYGNEDLQMPPIPGATESQARRMQDRGTGLFSRRNRSRPRKCETHRGRKPRSTILLLPNSRSKT